MRLERQREMAARERAAALQRRLGCMIAAGSSNDWLGAYAVIDFEALERLAAVKDLLKGKPGEVRAVCTYANGAWWPVEDDDD